MKAIRRVCLLGLGEVGCILADDLAAKRELELVAWDRQFSDPGSQPAHALEGRPALGRAASAAAAATGCDLVVSAVTAAQDFDAALSVRPGLESGAWFFDLNSVSPGTRRRVASLVDAAGARYVEAAILAPIGSRRIASPILAGGPHAAAFVPLARALGFAGLRFCAAEIGRAAATKMCRSVVVKGMEALLTEALVVARYHGVEAEVIASLGDLMPRPDWETHARYMISRALEHGTRRAEEMREAAETVAEAGLEPWMSTACAERQAWAARYAAALQHTALGPLLDAILELHGTRVGEPTPARPPESGSSSDAFRPAPKETPEPVTASSRGK